MLLAVSRFRVANGMEAQVREAFLHRPRLVDDVSGFLGMEVFDDTLDRTIFYLVTRWTDEDSYRVWHRSDAHRMSHSGIPKGMKLDASFTKVIALDRLQPGPGDPPLERLAADYAPLLAKFLSTSQQVHLLVMSRAGIVVSCNEAFERRLGAARTQLVGTHVRGFVTAADAAMLERRLASDARTPSEAVPIDFVGCTGAVFTLRCHMDVQPDAVVLIGEPLAPS